MDYEKAYKEMVQRAKELHESGNELTKKQMEIVCPQLAESEDERIRKWLIEMVEELRKANPTNAEHNGNCSEAIAYLEKQKDLKYSEEQMEDIRQYAYNKGIVYAEEKQKEQKPSIEEVLIKAGLHPYKDGNQWYILIGNNIQEGICGFGDTIDDALYHLLREAIAYQKEQKPAEWSEEDEEMLDAMIDIVSNSLYEPLCPREGMLAWLKSLSPQQKQEWSEEDEKKLKAVISLMKSNRAVDPFYDKMCLEGWLKSLRLQPHWKPSEEEMEALKEAVYQLDGSEYSGGIDSLYNDLQKLL